MKITAFAALIMAVGTYAVAVDSSLSNAQLSSRNDCGAGGAPYTRRTGSPCGNPKDHTYCGCDQTGIVSPISTLSRGWVLM